MPRAKLQSRNRTPPTTDKGPERQAAPQRLRRLRRSPRPAKAHHSTRRAWPRGLLRSRRRLAQQISEDGREKYSKRRGFVHRVLPYTPYLSTESSAHELHHWPSRRDRLRACRNSALLPT